MVRGYVISREGLDSALTAESLERGGVKTEVIESFGRTWVDMLRHVTTEVLSKEESALVVRAGAELLSEFSGQWAQHVEDGMLCAPTLVSPESSTTELTNNLASGFPELRYGMGVFDPRKGPEIVNCFDHGAVGLPLHVVKDVGNFDPNLKEFFGIVDYCVRSRWHGYQSYLLHDVPMRVAFDTFSVGHGEEAALMLMDSTSFERKYGGAILSNLSH